MDTRTSWASSNRHSADYSRQLLDQDPAAYIRNHTVNGHAYESHVGVSDVTLLDNVLSGKKRGDTAFKDADTEIYCTSELLYANMNRIIDFVEGTSNEKGNRLVLQTDFSDPDTGQPMEVGTRFLSDADNKYNVMQNGCGVRRISCSCAAVVITKNREIPGGWEITTSFPMAYPPDFLQPCVRIQGDFSNTLTATRTYALSSPTLQTYMDYACSGKPRTRGMRVEYIPEDGEKGYPEALRVSDRTGKRRFARETDAPAGLRPGRVSTATAEGLAESLSRRINYHKQKNRLRTDEMLRQANRLQPGTAPDREAQVEKGMGS